MLFFLKLDRPPFVPCSRFPDRTPDGPRLRSSQWLCNHYHYLVLGQVFERTLTNTATVHQASHENERKKIWRNVLPSSWKEFFLTFSLSIPSKYYQATKSFTLMSDSTGSMWWWAASPLFSFLGISSCSNEKEKGSSSQATVVMNCTSSLKVPSFETEQW